MQEEEEEEQQQGKRRMPSSTTSNPPPPDLPTQVELEALKGAFHALDADRDGRLSPHDILTTLTRLHHKATRASLLYPFACSGRRRIVSRERFL